MTAVVHGGELAQVRPREARLRTVEPGTARLVAQLLEDAQDRPNVPVPERPDKERRAMLRFEDSRVHSQFEKPTI
jgi:hypothetical protein